MGFSMEIIHSLLSAFPVLSLANVEKNTSVIMLGSTDMYQLRDGLQLPKHFQKLATKHYECLNLKKLATANSICTCTTSARYRYPIPYKLKTDLGFTVILILFNIIYKDHI